MSKIALLLLAVIAAMLWLRYKAGGLKFRAKPGPGPEIARMVKCTECALHLPATEALRDSAGRFYCCDAHRLAATGKP